MKRREEVGLRGVLDQENLLIARSANLAAFPCMRCKAINTLPVIDAWANAPWMQDPLAWSHKLAEGTGKRNDLIAASA